MRAIVFGVMLAIEAAGSSGAVMAFDLQGHRGARGLAPENTIAGFARALDIGVTTLETDLAITRDDVVVLSHDPRLNSDITRGPDGRWLVGKGPAIRSLTYDELQRFDVGRINPASTYARQFPEQVAADGARVPTLASLFALGAASGKAPRYNIEIKISPLEPVETAEVGVFARLVVDAVQAGGQAKAVTIQSFDWRALLAVQRLARDIETVCLTVDTPEDSTVRGSDGQPSTWLAGLDAKWPGASVPELVSRAGCGTWSPFWRNIDGANVKEARALGLKVVPWTVNAPADMAAMIALGIDGMITDYPDRARQVMGEKGIGLR